MIRLYLGRAGEGKTSMMVRDAAERFAKQPVQVYTNMADTRFPYAVYIADLEELSRVGNGLVILDEASVVLSSRHWQRVPIEVLTMLAQHRHVGLDLWMTAQHENRADTVIRELAGEYIQCKRFLHWVWMRETDPASKLSVKGRLGRLDTRYLGLYNTHENIEFSWGGSVIGSPELRALLSARKSRSAPKARFAMPGPAPAVAREWRGSSRVWTPEGRRALATLRASGLDLEACSESLVRYQCERLRWLALFGLSVDEVPYWLTQDTPWALGFSPEEVRAQRAAAAMVDADEKERSGRAKTRRA